MAIFVLLILSGETRKQSVLYEICFFKTLAKSKGRNKRFGLYE